MSQANDGTSAGPLVEDVELRVGIVKPRNKRVQPVQNQINSSNHQLHNQYKQTLKI